LAACIVGFVFRVSENEAVFRSIECVYVFLSRVPRTPHVGVGEEWGGNCGRQKDHDGANSQTRSMAVRIRLLHDFVVHELVNLLLGEAMH
jgi:hypothetical protein